MIATRSRTVPHGTVRKPLQLLFAFGVTLPPEFSTFFRALVTLEGTIVILSPGYPVIQSAQEVATEWAGEHLTVASLQELARDEVLRLAPLLRRAPPSRPGGEPGGAR